MRKSRKRQISIKTSLADGTKKVVESVNESDSVIVAGALGTVSKGLEKNAKKSGTMISVGLLQTTALFGVNE